MEEGLENRDTSGDLRPCNRLFDRGAGERLRDEDHSGNQSAPRESDEPLQEATHLDAMRLRGGGISGAERTQMVEAYSIFCPMVRVGG
jgi:hypothetical protein